MRVVVVMALSVAFGFAGNNSLKTEKASITINQTNFIVPPVTDLSLTTDHASKAYQYFAATMIPSNRLYACYTTSGDLTDSENGGIGDRGCLVESLKSSENLLISAQDLEQGRKLIRGNFEKMLNEQGQGFIDQVQSQIAKSRDTKDAISLGSLKMGQTAVLETLSDDEHSYTVLIAMKIIQSKDGITEETPMISSCATLVCKGKLLYFYATSKLKDASSVDWVKQVTKQWLKAFFDLNGINRASRHG